MFGLEVEWKIGLVPKEKVGFVLENWGLVAMAMLARSSIDIAEAVLAWFLFGGPLYCVVGALEVLEDDSACLGDFSLAPR